MITRIPITDISPAVNFGGELVPVKAVAGEVIAVTATIFREGHDELGAHALAIKRHIARACQQLVGNLHFVYRLAGTLLE